MRANPLTQLARRRHEAGLPTLDLTGTNPTVADIPYPEAEIRTAISAGEWLRYRPLPFGLPSARTAVAAALSTDHRPVRAEQVALTASTSEAYAFLFKLLCDPGDEILVPVPGYPLLEHLGTFESVRPVPYPLQPADDWAIDRAALTAAIGPRTRAIVCVQPNNPTGSVLRPDELGWLTTLGLPLIGDEVFGEYPLEADAVTAPDSRFSSVLAAEDGLVFSLGGLSKSAGLPQMKAAWIAVGGTPDHVSAALERLELIADTWLSVSAPVQAALPALLACRHVAADAIRARTRRNLAALRAALGSGSSISVPHVTGGWVAPLRLPATHDDAAWAMHLLQEQGVRVQPGHFYDFEQGTWLVISLLVPDALFDEGIERLISAVDG